MGQQRTILLIDDDQVDAMTVKRAMGDAGCVSSIVHVTHGESALAYLRSDVNPRPYLILLDLNMPKMNGLAFLREIKADPVLCGIPVVILSTSDSQDDVTDSFGTSAAAYVTKPMDYRQFVAKMRAIEQYWQINRLPGDEWKVYDVGVRTYPVG